MANMSYCRFQNTANDLRDCIEHIGDFIDKDEHNARKRIVEMCKAIVAAEEYGDIPEKPEDMEDPDMGGEEVE
jgi:hypothetical protein